MNTDTTLSMQLASSEDTEKLGEQLGRNLRGGEVIELVSDLGGGKTTLTRGIVRGSGSKDVVSSPTFTISKVYKSEKFHIHHYDFYRLSDAGLIEHEISDDLNDEEKVVIIEWGEVVQHVLPYERLTIQIDKTGDNSRELIIKFPEQYKYMVEKI